MDAPTSPPGAPQERLLGALLSAKDGPPDLTVVGALGPVVVLEIPSEGAGIALFDARGVSPADIRTQVEGFVKGHRAGTLYIVVAGGGAEVPGILREADRQAHDPNRLGLYHLDDSGRLGHVVGRRLRLLGRVAGRLETASPVSVEALDEVIARGKRERDEAVTFSKQIASRRPRVTIGILILCVAVFALTQMEARDQSESLVLHLLGANDVVLVSEGQVWRLLSYAFLHGGIAHIVMNMLALHGMGGFLEAVIGWRRYVVLYTVGALAGGLASAFISGSRLSVGASGAIAALITAAYALTLSRKQVLPGLVARTLRQRLGFTLLLNVAISFLPNIDLWAHLGGGAIGFALAALGLLTPDREREPRAVTTLAVICGVLLVGALLVALAVGRSFDPAMGAGAI